MMDIATITDAAVGTEVYYLEHIYMTVMLTLISFWELIVYGLVFGLLWFFVRQIYNIYD